MAIFLLAWAIIQNVFRLKGIVNIGFVRSMVPFSVPKYAQNILMTALHDPGDDDDSSVSQIFDVQLFHGLVYIFSCDF